MAENEQKKGSKKFIIIAILVVIAAVAGGVFYFLNAPKKMNINDYVTVEFTGYDSMGTATVTFDNDEFLYDFSQNAKLDSKIQREADKLGLTDTQDIFKEGLFADLDLQSRITYELNTSTDLSNGDEVVLSWSIDEDYIAEHYGIKLEADAQELSVVGLEDVVTFNPFDDLKVTFSGNDGEGVVELEITSDDDIYEGITFRADTSSGLSNGDKITVTYGPNFGKDLQTYCAQNYGMVPDPVTQEYEVTGLK